MSKKKDENQVNDQPDSQVNDQTQDQDNFKPDNQPDASDLPDEMQLKAPAEFWDFDITPVFEGLFLGDWQSDKGKADGYAFRDRQGVTWILGKMQTLESTLERVIDEKNGYRVRDYKNLWLRIEFEGKVELDGGKEFNKLRITKVKA